MMLEKCYGETGWKQWLDFRLGNYLNILTNFYCALLSQTLEKKDQSNK